MIDVFISYSRANRAKAEAVRLKLEAFSLDYYFDLEKTDGGANFPDVIDRALRDSKAVLCCWSPAYFASSWCMIECRDGLARGKLVPVAVEPFDMFAPPADLRQINWFDLVGWNGENDHENWRRTWRSLGKLVGRDDASPSTAPLAGGPAVGLAAAPASGAAMRRADILADLRATWAGFQAKSDIGAVERFFARVRMVAADSGVAFEVEQHLDELRIEATRAEAARRARETAEISARRMERATRARPGRVWRDTVPAVPKGASPEMITLPMGEFMMGSSSAETFGEERTAAEAPQHKVRIDYPFAIGAYAVTFAEWDAAIAVGAKLERPLDEGWGRGRRPVINVSWDDAGAYIAWLNARLALEGRSDAYRLPSEAEWEYACRAGTATSYSVGQSLAHDQANFRQDPSDGEGGHGDHRRKTAPVGSFRANAFGLHDMHGNVLEWCGDVWNDSYAEPERPDDGSAWLVGDASRRVLRGGSWNDGAMGLRSSARRGFHAAIGNSEIGFRVARTIILE